MSMLGLPKLWTMGSMQFALFCRVSSTGSRSAVWGGLSIYTWFSGKTRSPFMGRLLFWITGRGGTSSIVIFLIPARMLSACRKIISCFPQARLTTGGILRSFVIWSARPHLVSSVHWSSMVTKEWKVGLATSSPRQSQQFFDGHWDTRLKCICTLDKLDSRTLGLQCKLMAPGSRMLAHRLPQEQLEVWLHVLLIPALRRWKQEDLCELKASLAYIASFRITKATQW